MAATQKAIAEHSGLSRQTVAKYRKEGILGANDSLITALGKIRDHVDPNVNDELDLTQERTRKEKEQADKLEMENALTRGETVLVEDVEKIWSDEYTRVKNKLLAAPPKLAPLMMGVKTTAEAEEIIKSVVEEALNELSKPDTE